MCWAIQTPNGLVKNYDDPLVGFKTRTFKTRKIAQEYLQTHRINKGQTVKILLVVSLKEY
jgi:hypothetical protein